MTGIPELHAQERDFKVWEYQVSHGQLLIRSPISPATDRAPERVTNIDIVCTGVEYMSLPRLLRGIVMAPATLEEVRYIGALLGKTLTRDTTATLASNDRRFHVVASSFVISENDWDIFDSPFEFRSQFRGHSLKR